jgi:peroxiredoxin
VEIGSLFPRFDLPDLEGRTWRRSDLAGRPAVVFCFSTW